MKGVSVVLGVFCCGAVTVASRTEAVSVVSVLVERATVICWVASEGFSLVLEVFDVPVTVDCEEGGSAGLGVPEEPVTAVCGAEGVSLSLDVCGRPVKVV